jgi:hypothetical protein
MTEQEHDQTFLTKLIEQPIQPGTATDPGDPLLTSRDERQLLHEANSAAPPTLAPFDADHPYSAVAAGAHQSFAADVFDIVRRHPIPALLLAGGLAYLLARRKV